MALRATPGFQEGSTTLSCDGRNAFNDMSRSKSLPAVASVAPDYVRYRQQPPGADSTLPELLYHTQRTGRPKLSTPHEVCNRDVNPGPPLCSSARRS